MDFTLIKVKETDIPFLLELRMSTMSEHFEKANVSLSTAHHLELVKENFDRMFFVLFNNIKIGMLKYEETNSVCKIYQLQVMPIHQGKGYGRNVLSWFIKNTKCEAIELNVLKQNRALNLYTSLGFIKVGEDEYEYHLRHKP